MQSFPLIIALLCVASLEPSASAQPYWEPAGLADTNLTALSINTRGDIVAASAPARTLHFSTDGGSTWATFAPVSIFPFMIALDDSGFLYAADPDAFGNGLQRTSDIGATWKILSDSATSGCYSLGVGATGELFATFAELPPGGVRFVYHSTSHGDFWTRDSTALSVALMFNLSSQSVYAFSPSGDVFAIGTDGIYRTQNHGATWERKVNGLPGTIVKTLCINSKGVLFVQGDFVTAVGSLCRSTDDGDSWSAVPTTGLPAFPEFVQLTTDAKDQIYGVVQGTTADGVYRSTDDGATWTNVTAGLPATFGMASLSHGPGGSMYCATHDGLFRGTTALTSAGMDEGSAVSWTLEQNYPNPFNPRTVIGYTVGGFGNQASGFRSVRLVVHDLLGREVAVLVNTQKRPGRYSASFDGSACASGIYVYRLTAGNMILTRKMILIR